MKKLSSASDYLFEIVIATS